MYSTEGKRIVNMLLAGKETALANYIALGINTVYDATIRGDAYPTTHNRYHSPYIVDEIEIQNSTVLDEDSGEQIKYAGTADAGKSYVANNIGLILKRSNASTNEQRIVCNALEKASSESGVGWSNVDTIDNAVRFTNETTLGLTNGSTASYNGAFSLYSSSIDDILSFPLYFANATDDGVVSNVVDSKITLSIRYQVNGIERSVDYTKSIVVGLNGLQFEVENAHNGVPDVGTFTNPAPFLFQRRIWDYDYITSTGNPQELIVNGNNIIGVNLTYSGGSGNRLHFGSVKICPDFSSDIGRTTIAFRKLITPLHKTANATYTNAEYTLYGMV